MKIKPISTSLLNRNLVGGILGNVLEWYDFAIYGYLVSVIGQQFFPKEDLVAQLISAYGIFAVGYFMRPFGGLILGSIGDRLGRKSSLQLSMCLMALPTFLIGCLPSYEHWGLIASILLVVLRMFQGLSVGGEAISSFSFLTELAPSHQRGLYGSLVYFGALLGMVLGSLMVSIAHQSFSPEFMSQWGWRFPFWGAIFLAGFGLWMRQDLKESPEYEQLKRQNQLSSHPVLEVLQTQKNNVFKVIGLTATVGGGFYLLFTWWPTYLSKIVNRPIANPFMANTIALVCLAGFLLVGGILADRFSAKKIFSLSLLGLLFLTYPLFILAEQGSFALALLAQLGLAVVMGGILGAAPLLMTQLFPTRFRTSGVGLGYNLGQSLLSGTAPLMATALIQVTGSIQAPALYLIGLSLLSLICVRTLHSGGADTKVLSK